MDLAIHGGMSPEDIIQFIQQHTEEYSTLIKTEMQQAQDRTTLMQDLANLASELERDKTIKDDAPGNVDRAKKAHAALAAFHEKHPDAAIELTGIIANTDAWSANQQIDWSTANHDRKEGFDNDSANKDYDQTIKDLTNLKDKIAGDDKIGMMTLQEDASRMKELYELGSNLLAKGDQVGNVLISNIKG